jgi:hypothetical protein
VIIVAGAASFFIIKANKRFKLILWAQGRSGYCYLIFNTSFLCSAKSIIILETEKDRVVGFEPVTKFLPVLNPALFWPEFSDYPDHWEKLPL